jgi:hypothetical protein
MTREVIQCIKQAKSQACNSSCSIIQTQDFCCRCKPCLYPSIYQRTSIHCSRSWVQMTRRSCLCYSQGIIWPLDKWSKTGWKVKRYFTLPRFYKIKCWKCALDQKKRWSLQVYVNISWWHINILQESSRNNQDRWNYIWLKGNRGGWTRIQE